MWIKESYFKYASAIILALLIIFLFGKIDYFVSPFQMLVASIFFPILVTGLFYYILRPIVTWLSKYMNKTISILIVFLFLFLGGYVFFYYMGTIIGEQITQLSDKFPEQVEEISQESKEMVKGNNFAKDALIKLEQRANAYSRSFYKIMENNIGSILSALTGVATVLTVVPFALFYFLRDDEKFKPSILKHLPDDHKEEGNRILSDIDRTMSAYIVGQFIIALSDGILLYIGFLIIGIDNSLVLALFATSLTIVPFVGPILGIVPAIFVALLSSPIMVLKVIIVAIVVQQIEGNLITPRVMSKSLDLHPLTVIFILLIAGSLYGFIGIIVAIPIYSVVKVTIRNVILLYKLRTMGPSE
ncbi:MULTISPECIES: AI-2E family transporter [unclassified Bacillus (in: firmicutes)]|uniref:AI-2E family transporter n=1 Tax=unclassified Bacillus (in: firmicutes) TaxID=185979 RepID=UPI0008E1C638|nr:MULTISPECIES: AI-2E family transporter [unclassified Bacillus (in: firmicutes)]SFA71821.1 Predicted PurR-regulated permease PerM [Bacillus sp. UNCCL13]SFQ62127.1 Predicted PurR-regulated permease PerM [Bacillus sp. cl95]